MALTDYNKLFEDLAANISHPDIYNSLLAKALYEIVSGQTAGDIGQIIADTGLTGGGASGIVSLAVDVGTDPGQIPQVQLDGLLEPVDDVIPVSVKAAMLTMAESFTAIS